MAWFSHAHRSPQASPLVSAMIAATLSLCTRSALAAPVAATPTVQQLMVTMAAASGKIWNAVGVVNDASGTHEKAPSTPAEWHELRRQAMLIAEASKLLATPGRPVAGHNTATTIEGGEPLDVTAIQQRLAANPAALGACAQSVHGVALQLAQAADRHDVQKFSDLGSTLDEVIEGCHKIFWYPDQK